MGGHNEPCPYCGSTSVFVDFDSDGLYLERNACLARGPIGNTRAEAEENWNRRATDG